MKHPGVAFRQIRLQKGFSVKEVSGEFVTPQFLNKFERGVSDIRFSTLLELLTKMNVTIAEFSFFLEDTLDNWMISVEQQIDEAYLTGDSLGFSKFIQENEKLYQETNEIRYKLVAKVAKHHYNRTMAEIYDIDVSIVKEYLRNTESWGRFELYIVSYLAHLFEVEESIIYARQIFKKLDDDFLTNGWRYDAFLHIFLHMVQCEELEVAEVLWKDYIKLFDSERNIGYLHYDLFGRYIQGLLLILKGDTSGFLQCERVIKTFSEDAGYAVYARRLHVQLQRIQKQAKKG